MKFFYTGLNKFMWNHPFIKSCTHFTSRFCPYMVAIFYMLFLLKIYLDRPHNLLGLAAEPIAVFASIHVAMSISIALAVLHFGPNMGLLLSTLAIAISLCRLLSGVHYLTDILASIAIAFIVNLI